MASDARRIVQSVLGDHMTSQIWTSNYAPVFPFTPQDFSVGALLPMILYLFRWGHRRGRGKFKAAFSLNGSAPTIRSVANRLAQEPTLSGIDGQVAKGILGDMLLTSALENRRHAEGHDEQVQRCFPNHYLASWIDLPQTVANLRGVPEMITALLNDQREDEFVEPFQERGRLRIGSRVEDNDLLTAFATGVSTKGTFKSDLKSDQFSEDAPLAIDQLIMVRLAQACGEAPAKATGKGEPGPIPNQRPIAIRAAKHFREDLLVFFDCYGRDNAVPRAPLLAMLESCFAVGLTTIVLSTATIMLRWGETGALENESASSTFPVFFDCSNGADVELRNLSEVSSNLVRQAISRLPAILMHARLLDFWIRTEADIPRNERPPKSPDGTVWLRLLGEFVNGGHAEARDANRFFRGKSRALLDACEAEPDAAVLVNALRDEQELASQGRALAEALSTAFAEAGGPRDRLYTFLSSALMVDEINGLARRRRIVVSGKRGTGQRRTADAVSFVLTNTVLEYLVHRHLRRTADRRKPQGLSFPAFLDILRDRYGFYVDRAPPNMQAPADLLQRNRKMLERRLRDLGLLAGVNDAERMKKLKARYHSAYDQEVDAV